MRNWQNGSPLTEHTLRETQARIEQILRLDYDTFVNVSFFLQGRADQFAQQPPTRRKEILAPSWGWRPGRDTGSEAADRRRGPGGEARTRWMGAWPRSTPNWLRKNTRKATPGRTGEPAARTGQPAASSRRSRAGGMSSRSSRPGTNSASWSDSWVKRTWRFAGGPENLRARLAGRKDGTRKHTRNNGASAPAEVGSRFQSWQEARLKNWKNPEQWPEIP